MNASAFAIEESKLYTARGHFSLSTEENMWTYSGGFASFRGWHRIPALRFLLPPGMSDETRKTFLLLAENMTVVSTR